MWPGSRRAFLFACLVPLTLLVGVVVVRPGPTGAGGQQGPRPVPQPVPGVDRVLFRGDKLADFDTQAAPGAITEVPDPLGSGQIVLKFTVNDDDVYPITPTDNPRAQAIAPIAIEPGEEFWLSTKLLLPEDLPPVPGWMSLVAIYGAPFAGAGPWGVGITEDEFRWQRNGTYDWDIPWRAPLVKGRWVSLLMHQRFGNDGWVEMWIDGEKVTFFPRGNYNPRNEPETERLSMETMDASNRLGPNAAKLAQYREAGMFGSATVYFGTLVLDTVRTAPDG